jgi:hypothetical protein
MKNLQAYINLATLEAEKGPMSTQYAAILIDAYSGEVISRGHSRYKSNMTSKAPYCPLRG